ncbi:store-operated calcium entry regulator STIMATE isoform X3 [Accipiter gentilis]|uniref:store-operated calcium entry regulator STIMATE isoform X3 n=1 Tax=Astur gentilis TaxID=8957 RepID=UPI00210FAAA9|nr:store-operated calcium entry regulator STIMATE isoform X3 [Accipiter gentilis]
MQNIWYVVPKPLKVASTSRTFCDPCDREAGPCGQEWEGERDLSSAVASAPTQLFLSLSCCGGRDDTTFGAGSQNRYLKRFREPKHERRPWRIWFLDTSKQAIGMLFIHFANVYLSDLTEEDPCSLYLINFLLDATLGMLLIYIGIRVVSSIVEWQQWESLRFGEYGDPLQCSAWVGQCALYIMIMTFEKTIIIIVLLIPQWKEALMFWVVDNFLMKKGKTKAKLEEKEAGQDSRNGSKVRYRRAASHEESESEILISADDEMEESDAEEDLRRLTNLKPIKKKKHRFGLPV